MDKMVQKVWNYEEIQHYMKMGIKPCSKVDDLPTLVEERIFQTWWTIFHGIRKRQ